MSEVYDISFPFSTLDDSEFEFVLSSYYTHILFNFQIELLERMRKCFHILFQIWGFISSANSCKIFDNNIWKS
jgi:hypothetical protein